MAYGRGKFTGKGKKKDNEWVRVTTLFKKDPNDIPDFLRAKWSVVLHSDDEYYEKLKQAIENADEKGALVIDASRSKDDEDGNLVLSVCAVEPRENGKRGSKKKSRDDDDDGDEKPAKKKGKRRRDEEDD